MRCFTIAGSLTIGIGLVFAAFLPQPLLAANSTQNVIFVGSGPACSDAAFTVIQEAINAAPNDSEIHVCTGVYAENLIIEGKSLTLTADHGAILAPTTIPTFVPSLATGNPLAAIIRAQSGGNVQIENLTIDGSLIQLYSCAPDLIGVLFQNTSGTIQHLVIHSLQLLPLYDGCQSGSAIFVQSGAGGRSVVNVVENQVSEFQKNGITANEVGTYVRIKYNVVSGLGPTTGAAQNGIQIGYGAKGEIQNNLAAGFVWSPCISPSQCQWYATGILVEQSPKVRVTGNSLGDNQVDIVLNGPRAQADLNQMYSSVTLDSVQVLADGVKVTSNTIFNSSEYAVSVLADGVAVSGNTIVNAPIGIYKSSTVADFSQGENNFVDVGTDILDPAPDLLTSANYLPYR